MRVRYIANAGAVYSHEKYKILADPWILGFPFEGSWSHRRPLKSKPSDYFDSNLIFLSHGHSDHCDEDTLKEFPKDIPVVIYDHKMNFLKRKIEALGFKNIEVMKDKEARQFGPFTITMFGPFTGHLFHETEIGNIIDSAIILEAGGHRVFNANDNPPDLKSARMLKEMFGSFDLIQLVDATAGPYPGCFTNLTHEQKLSERDRILNRHLDLMIEVARILGPTKIQPFAGSYCLKGPLEYLNQYLGVLEPHEVHERYKAAGLDSLLLYEGDEYEFG